MLKLLTDPTVYPIREVALQRANGTLAVTGIRDAGGFDDLKFQRPDGRYNVMFRDRRTELTLDVDAIGWQQAQALQELAGLSYWGRTRTPVQVSPWFDSRTLLYAPLTGTLKALKRDAATSTLQKFSLTHTRSSVLQVTDEAGNVVTKAVNEPAFVPSAVGPGMYQHFYEYEQLLATPHATGVGTLGWSAGSVAQLDWDTSLRSPYRDAGGVLRVEVPAGSPVESLNRTHDTLSASSAEHYLYTVEVRGRGVVKLRAAWGISPAAIGSDVTLTDSWQTLTLAVPKAFTTSTAILYLEFAAQSYRQVCYVGRCGFYYFGNNFYYAPEPAWQLTGIRGFDVLTVGGTQPAPPVSTIAVAGLLPKAPFAWCNLFYLSDGAYAKRVGFYGNPTAYVYATLGSTDAKLYSTDINWVPGAPFVAVARFGSDGKPRITLQTSRTHAEKVSTGINTAHPDPSGITLGAYAAYVATQHIRYDDRYWSDAEVLSYCRLMESESLRPLLARTAGRKFVLEDVDLVPVTGRRQELSGSITLSEIDIDPDFAFAA